MSWLKPHLPWPTVLIYESVLGLPYRGTTAHVHPYNLIGCYYGVDEYFGRFIKLQLQRAERNRLGILPVCEPELDFTERHSPYIAGRIDWLEGLMQPFK